MQEVCHKIENLFLKAGQFNRYQIIITVLFTLEFCCTHFLNYCIPYFERLPEINTKGVEITQEFYYDLCNNLDDFSIIQNLRIKTSIVYEFDIMCNKKKIYFLGLCYYIGKFFGGCL